MKRYWYRLVISGIFIFALIIIFWAGNDKKDEEGTGIVKPQNPSKVYKQPINVRKKQQQPSSPGAQTPGQQAQQAGGSADEEEILPPDAKPPDRKPLGQQAGANNTGAQQQPFDPSSLLSKPASQAGAQQNDPQSKLSCDNAAKTSQEILGKIHKDLHAVFAPLPDNLKKAIEEGILPTANQEQPDIFNTSQPPVYTPDSSKHPQSQQQQSQQSQCNPNDPSCKSGQGQQNQNWLPNDPVELKKLWWQLADKCKSFVRRFSLRDALPPDNTGDINNLRLSILRGWMNPKFRDIVYDWGACEKNQCKNQSTGQNEPPIAGPFDPVNFVLTTVNNNTCTVSQPGPSGSEGRAGTCTCQVEPAFLRLKSLPLDGDPVEIPLDPSYANDPDSRRNRLKFYIDTGVPLGNKLVTEGTKFLRYADIIHQFFKEHPYEFAPPTELEDKYFESLLDLAKIIVDWNTMFGIPMPKSPPPLGSKTETGCPELAVTTCPLNISDFVKPDNQNKCSNILTILDFARKNPQVLNAGCQLYYEKLECIKRAADYGRFINKVIYEPWYDLSYEECTTRCMKKGDMPTQQCEEMCEQKTQNRCQYENSAHILDPEDLIGSFLRSGGRTVADFDPAKILTVSYTEDAILKFRICVYNFTKNQIQFATQAQVGSAESTPYNAPLKLFDGRFSIFIGEKDKNSCNGSSSCITPQNLAKSLTDIIKKDEIIKRFSQGTNALLYDLLYKIDTDNKDCEKGLTMYSRYGYSSKLNNAFSSNSVAYTNASCFDRLQSLLCLGKKDVIYKVNQQSIKPVPLITLGTCYKCDYLMVGGPPTSATTNSFDPSITICEKKNENNIKNNGLLDFDDSTTCKEKNSLPSSAPFGMCKVAEGGRSLNAPVGQVSCSPTFKRCFANWKSIDKLTKPQGANMDLEINNVYMGNMTSYIVANSLLDVGFNAVFNTLYKKRLQLDFLRTYLEIAANNVDAIAWNKIYPYLPLILLSKFNPKQGINIWQENMNLLDTLVNICFTDKGEFSCNDKTALQSLLNAIKNNVPNVGIFSPELMACYFRKKMNMDISGGPCDLISSFFEQTYTLTISSLPTPPGDKNKVICKRVNDQVAPYGKGLKNISEDTECGGLGPYNLYYLLWGSSSGRFRYPLPLRAEEGNNTQYTPVGLIAMFIGQSQSDDNISLKVCKECDFVKFLDEITGIVGLNSMNFTKALEFINSLAGAKDTKELLEILQQRVIDSINEALDYLKVIPPPPQGSLEEQFFNFVINNSPKPGSQTFQNATGFLKKIQLYPTTTCDDLFNTYSKVSALKNLESNYFTFILTPGNGFALPYYVRQEFYGCMGSYLDNFLKEGTSPHYLMAAYLPVFSITGGEMGGFDKLMTLMKDYILRFAGVYGGPYLNEGNNMLIKTLPDMIKLLSSLAKSVQDGVAASDSSIFSEYLKNYTQNYLGNFKNLTTKDIVSNNEGLSNEIRNLFLNLSLAQPLTVEGNDGVKYVFHNHLLKGGGQDQKVVPIFWINSDTSSSKDKGCITQDMPGNKDTDPIPKAAVYLKPENFRKPQESNCKCFAEDFSCFSPNSDMYSAIGDNDLSNAFKTIQNIPHFESTGSIGDIFIPYMLITTTAETADAVGQGQEKGKLKKETIKCLFSLILFLDKNIFGEAVGNDYTSINEKCNTLLKDNTSKIPAFWTTVAEKFRENIKKQQIKYLNNPECILLNNNVKSGICGHSGTTENPMNLRTNIFNNIFSPKSWGGVFLCGNNGNGGGQLKPTSSFMELCP